MRIASPRGFTIVEALVAIVLVTSGVLALVQLAQQITDTVARSRRQLVAAWLAEAAVAGRAGPPFGATAPDCLQHDVGGCMDTVDGHGQPTTAAPAFVRRWRVAPVTTGPGAVWSIAACVVPAAQRAVVARAPGACAVRLAHEAWP
ncbi:MAG: type II secretion system protein [Vicinamibacterales bacterium]